jgi:hypothetical protein
LVEKQKRRLTDKQKHLLLFLFVAFMGLLPGLFVGGRNLVSETFKLKPLPEIPEIVIQDSLTNNNQTEVIDETVNNSEVIDTQDNTNLETNIITETIQETQEDFEETLSTSISEVYKIYLEPITENGRLIMKKLSRNNNK